MDETDVITLKKEMLYWIRDFAEALPIDETYMEEVEINESLWEETIKQVAEMELTDPMNDPETVKGLVKFMTFMFKQEYDGR